MPEHGNTLTRNNSASYADTGGYCQPDVSSHERWMAIPILQSPTDTAALLGPHLGKQYLRYYSLEMQRQHQRKHLSEAHARQRAHLRQCAHAQRLDQLRQRVHVGQAPTQAQRVSSLDSKSPSCPTPRSPLASRETNLQRSVGDKTSQQAPLLEDVRKPRCQAKGIPQRNALEDATTTKQKSISKKRNPPVLESAQAPSAAPGPESIQVRPPNPPPLKPIASVIEEFNTKLWEEDHCLALPFLMSVLSERFLHTFTSKKWTKDKKTGTYELWGRWVQNANNTVANRIWELQEEGTSEANRTRGIGEAVAVIINSEDKLFKFCEWAAGLYAFELVSWVPKPMVLIDGEDF